MRNVLAAVSSRMKVVTGCMLLIIASTCFAQMYTVTNLGSLGGLSTLALGINNSGQVVGSSTLNVGSAWFSHPFRTAPNKPINPATDDLGALGWSSCTAWDINDRGQVVGDCINLETGYTHAFRTAPNKPIAPATDDLGTLGGLESFASGVNKSGQVVGRSWAQGDVMHAFRTDPNKAINPETDDLGSLGGGYSEAHSINDLGQVVGESYLETGVRRAFRTAPEKAINPATDDLGTLGGLYSTARDINNLGQVVGTSTPWIQPLFGHAFRTAPNSPINPATDDLGTPPAGVSSKAWAMNSYGEVVGYYLPEMADSYGLFLYSNGVMHDLNHLLPAGSGCCHSVSGINDAGQIVATGYDRVHDLWQAFLLTPIYKALVQPPVSIDLRGVFKSRRVLPVKFTLTEKDVPTCRLPAATMQLVDAVSGAPVLASQFRTEDCEYHYNLRTSSLPAGAYRIDININGIMVGHAVFALK